MCFLFSFLSSKFWDRSHEEVISHKRSKQFSKNHFEIEIYRFLHSTPPYIQLLNCKSFLSSFLHWQSLEEKTLLHQTFLFLIEELSFLKLTFWLWIIEYMFHFYLEDFCGPEDLFRINQIELVRVFSAGEARHDKLLLDSRHHYPRSHQVGITTAFHVYKLIYMVIWYGFLD